MVREEVDEVVCPGIEGEFGVLPGHTPFLTALKIGELNYRVGDKRKYIAITWGYAEVDGERVEILADMAETAEEIDLRRAEEAKARAESKLRGSRRKWSSSRRRSRSKRRSSGYRLPVEK